MYPEVASVGLRQRRRAAFGNRPTDRSPRDASKGLISGRFRALVLWDRVPPAYTRASRTLWGRSHGDA
jgi:hypothetical protein